MHRTGSERAWVHREILENFGDPELDHYVVYMHSDAEDNHRGGELFGLTADRLP